MELTGKVAIVTGAAVRLGRELALALAERGVKLCVHYHRSAGAAAETVRAIQGLGVSAAAVAADLSEAGRAAELIMDCVAKRFGHADILVNSAAVFEPGDLAAASEQQWDRHFAVNLKGPFFLTRAFALRCDGRRHGHVVNIADWRATRPGRHPAAYALTKSALVAMTRNLALELAPSIQVNAIAPGAILPPVGRGRKFMERLADTVPLRRTGSPRDVARALLFLLESDFITGQVLYVDGGQHL